MSFHYVAIFVTANGSVMHTVGLFQTVKDAEDWIDLQPGKWQICQLENPNSRKPVQ